MKQYWLLNPGPVNTTATVKQAALAADLCHREPEYSALMTEVRHKLLEATGIGTKGYQTALIAGSGTAALELSIASIVRPQRKLLVLNNGVYGARLLKMAQAHGIDCRDITSPWHQPPSVDAVEHVLREDASVDAVALVHHETTTGLLNPVEAIGRLARRYDKVFFLDSVSGLGGETLDIDGWGVDLVAATANKCLHGLPGVAFVLASDRGRAHVAEVPPRSVYFDLRNYLEQQEAGAVPFTPCISGTYTLLQALDELEAEGGISQRIATYRERSSLIRREFQALGLSLYLDEALLSNSITTFKLPKGLSYVSLHERLKQEGFVIYAGQGKLEHEVFRIANMGHVPMEIYVKLVDALRHVLRDIQSVATI
ncbi:MAG: alanine--glyoxylate aminotransferase family protein [Myxococcales bacterium]|nr:alanine--glyoxylate aminotransferase family protein [Myxococcales bacterium]